MTQFIHVLQRGLLVLIFLVPAGLLVSAPRAQFPADDNSGESDPRLASFNANTGILHIPSMPYDGAFIWVDLLYDGEDQATLIASGPASSEQSLVSLDSDTGQVSVPFIAFEGVEDNGRYALGLVILSSSPEVVLHIDSVQQHNLQLTEIPGSDINPVVANNNGRYLGLIGYPGDTEVPFGVIFVMEGDDDLSTVTLFLNEHGVPTSLVHNNQVMLINNHAGDPVNTEDGDYQTLASAARVLVTLSCELQDTTAAPLGEALQQMCNGLLLTTLSYLQDSGLVSDMNAIIGSVTECAPDGTPACNASFQAGLSTVADQLQAAVVAEEEATAPPPPPPNRRPTLSTVVVPDTVLQGEAFSLSFNTLMAASDASDEDGSVVGFVVRSVVEGSLSIDGAPFDELSNNLIDPTRNAVWTAPSSTGNSDAFTLVARDNEGAESLTAVAVAISVNNRFSGGEGTQTSPWEISTAAELDQMRDHAGAYFVLTADIDLGGDDPSGPFYNDGYGWLPIGDADVFFSGRLNGQGHAIDGLYINRPGRNSAGLFGATSWGGTLSNLNLRHVNITANNRTGGLVGNNRMAVRRVQVSGTITGGDSTGGLVGHNVGSSSIAASSSSAAVRGRTNTGGLLGFNEMTASVTNSYAIGAVDGTGATAGLVGGNVGSIFASYSSGRVTGTGFVAGLSACCGGVMGNIQNSFWDLQTSNQTGSPRATGLTTTEMKNQASFTNWNFGNVWAIDPAVNFGYPHLQWQSWTAPAFSEINVGQDPVVQGESVTFTFAQLLAASDASADNAGIIAFIVHSVDAGSLAIGGEPFDGTTNNRIDDTHDVVWTAPANSVGDLDIFAVVAIDDAGTQSATPVPLEVSVGPAFAGGSGTEVSPWEVSSAQQLNRVRSFLDGHFELTADIDLGGDDPDGSFYNEGDGWLPIADSSEPFSGSLYGQGHRINGLFINRSADNELGLFGALSADARLHKLSLNEVEINANLGATFDGSTGSLAGHNNGGTISQSRAAGSITGESVRVGGLVGRNSGNISESHSAVAVTGQVSVGGLVGWNEGGAVEQSYSTGAVVGNGFEAGGLVGWNEEGTISQSFATGLVGGGAWFSGGLVGDNENGTVDESFWDTDTSGQTSSDGGTGLTSSTMKDQSSYTTDGFDWDFDDIWSIDPAINGAYPHLRENPPQ